MSAPILATKLYIPPPRPDMIPRPRLIERLNVGLLAGRKLTLISALPALVKPRWSANGSIKRRKAEGHLHLRAVQV